MHQFKMKCNPIILSKVDLRQTLSLQNNHSLKITLSSFPLQKKLKHPSFRISRANSLSKLFSEKISSEIEEGERLRLKRSTSSWEMKKRPSKQEDKTFNNNYQQFPKRRFLRSPYIVQNSNIVIDIFTKKIEYEQRKHEFFSNTLSQQLRSCSQKIFASERPRPIKLNLQNSIKFRLSTRSQSTKSVGKFRRQQKVTPWEVQTYSANSLRL